MSQHDYGETFGFVEEPADRSLAIRPGSSRRGGLLRRGLVPAVGISLHVAVLLFFLNFAGIVRVPRLEGLTRERLWGGPTSSPTVTPSPPPAIAPAPATQPRPVAILPGRNPPAASPVRFAGRVTNPAIRPQPDEPAPAGGSILEAAEAEAVLAANALVRGPAGFILRSEATVRRGLTDLRARIKACVATYRQSQRFLEARQIIDLSNQAINHLDESIKQGEVAMSQFPTFRVGGVTFRGYNNQQVAAFNNVKAQHDQDVLNRAGLIRQRNDARQAVQREGLAKAPEAYDRHKADALEALSSFRAAIQAFRSEHDSAAANPAVRQALARVGHGPLVPSPALLADVAELNACERAMNQGPTFRPEEWPASWRAGR